MKIQDVNLQNKNVYVVLGMARSGTSVISRGLKALGIDLGSKLTPGSKWNPKGFWEDNDIVYKVNERVLGALHYSWDSIKLINTEAQTQASLQEYKLLASKLLLKRLALTDHWGFKDPRTVKILAFWQSVFKSLNVKENYIIALRNPLACAESYQKLTGADIEHGLLLWLRHMLSAIDGTQGKNRVVVSYDLMMQAPSQQLLRIQQQLHMQLPSAENELHSYSESFLDKKLYHFEYTLDDLATHKVSAIIPLCLDVYTWLFKVAKDEVQLSDPEFITAWNVIKQEFHKLSPLYDYVDTLLQRHSALKKSIRTLHKSRLWKLIYPLRLIDNALRKRRKKVQQLRLAEVK